MNTQTTDTVSIPESSEYTVFGLTIMHGARVVAMATAHPGKYDKQQKELHALCDAMNDSLAGRVCFWTYEVDDAIFDAEFNTQDEAFNWADEAYAEERITEGDRGTHSQQIKLIRFSYNEDTGERIVHREVRDTVEWTYERSDYEEHNTMYRGGSL